MEAGRSVKIQWFRGNEVPAWMDFPEEEISEDDEEEETWEDSYSSNDDDEEDEGYFEEGKEYREEDSYEKKMRRKMCIAWLFARKEISNMIVQENHEEAFHTIHRHDEQGERSEQVERMEEIMKTWGEVSAEEKIRAGWKASEMERLSDISLMISMKNVRELEQAMKRQRKETQEEALQQDMELETADKNYLDFRNMWIAIHSGWGGVFECTTTICPMQYTGNPVPRYVYNYGPPHTLQLFSVKVAGKSDGGLHQWPLQVFGLVALRDSIDQHRNVIFNRTRDDCQILTKEDPYLVLTGPKRAVVINEESIPVTIEAELKVKSSDGSEDKHLIFAAAALPYEFGSGSIDLTGRYMNLKVALGRIITSVEATIFTRVIEGTWPAGFHGQLAARTSSISHRKIVLADFGGDDLPVGHNGDVDQSRLVVSVESFGELMVSCRAWRGVDEMIQDEVAFKAEKKGRSFGALRVGSCILEVLVAWSPIRPVCEELVSMSEMAFAK